MSNTRKLITPYNRGGQPTMYQQPTDAIDVPYEPYSNNYSHSQTSSSNTGWSGRSKNVYGRASSASNYTRGITPAMESGAGAAIGTIGTVASHSNPFKPWRSIAFWSMGVGFVTVIGWIGSAVLGGFIAARNPRPLPSNAPNAMRFGHGLVRVGTPVAGGVVQGVKQVSWGAANSVDQAVRLQLAGNSGWEIGKPQNVAPQPAQVNTNLPLTTWTGGTGYQLTSTGGQ